MKKTAMAAGLAAALLIGSSAFAASINDLGVQGDVDAVTREVLITAETRWVNVESGETIKFVNGAGQSLVWRFDTGSWATGSLADFAPQLAQGRDIRVYVAENVLYRSDI